MMKTGKRGDRVPDLDPRTNENMRRHALRELCEQYRLKLQDRNPQELARLAAVGIETRGKKSFVFNGEHLLQRYLISWPELIVTDTCGNAAPLQTELLWLHYLDRADGHPLTGRWVNLSEIGGLFYQQAFQGYCGDKVAEIWGSDLEGLHRTCHAMGGWAVPNLADLAFEWRVLPRLPLCLCYRLPTGSKKAWATMLFDAAADHYVAADVAAIVGKSLADRIVPNGNEVV